MKHSKADHWYSGFSLVEVTLAVAIAAVALLSVIGMLPHAMEMSHDSADQTAIGVILEDARDRVEGAPLKSGVPEVSPIYYDQRGQYLHDLDSLFDAVGGGPFFRIDLELKPIHVSTRPANVSDVRAVQVKVFWPLKSDGQEEEKWVPISPEQPNLEFSYYVNALTGPDWMGIDPKFEPKIEF